MKFFIAIEQGDDDHAFGVVAPDLPGCFSAGDTLMKRLKTPEKRLIYGVKPSLRMAA